MSPADTGPAPPPARPIAGLRVAVLEDDTELLDMICDALGSFGCTAAPYPSGEAFTRMLPGAATGLDLLIADVNLGGMDGTVAVRAAREARPDLPVILVSGDLRPLMRARDRRQMSLMKPFTAETLRQVIHTLMS